jgi:hypothetical protein
MYEALVARVRYHIQKANFMGLKEAESTLLLAEAADAIEELSYENESLAKSVNETAELLHKRGTPPKWIPVTERLPEPKFAREWYLVALESGCVKSLAYEKKGRTDNLFRPGWHETASPVTHWMPLPEPPKEGET